MKINFVSISSLILANLYPIYGVYFLGWGVPKIIFLYFIETVLIAFYGLLKMYFLKYENINTPVHLFRQRFKKLFGFFFIYSFWLGVAYVFLSVLIFDESNAYSYISYEGIFFMLISHGISFYTNFIKKNDFEKNSMTGLFFEIFFLRIAPIHFFIFLSSYLLNSIVGPILISFFILAKTIIDLFFHILEHRRMNYYNVEKPQVR
jgi:hypothetical protein